MGISQDKAIVSVPHTASNEIVLDERKKSVSEALEATASFFRVKLVGIKAAVALHLFNKLLDGFEGIMLQCFRNTNNLDIVEDQGLMDLSQAPRG